MVGIRPRNTASVIRMSMLSEISLDVQTSPLSSREGYLLRDALSHVLGTVLQTSVTLVGRVASFDVLQSRARY